MDRGQLVAQVAERVRRRFAGRGSLSSAPGGELNAYVMDEIRRTVNSLNDPYNAIIRGWEGQGYHLDLCWWEAEENPEAIVLGLAGAILEYEVRHQLGLPA